MFDAFGAALAAALVVAGPVAVAVTKLVDFIRNLFGASEPNIPSWVWNVLAMVLGVAIALGWGVNVFGAIVSAVPALAESDALKGDMGTVLTGLLIGGMAGFWHDKMAQWSAARKARTG
jgi:hypothetical protein